MSAKFGPAGTAESFKAMGYKKSVQLPEYLKKFGLDHFEYQCGQGVRISEQAAAEIGAAFRENGMTLSLHAPYFISLSGTDEEKRLGSVKYILDSARAAKAMGARRIVIHSGSCSKISRTEALELAKDTMKQARRALISEGLEDIICCPETMGKINQLGTLEEVIEICKVDDTFLPTVDFGHLNARTFGGIKTKQDYADMLDKLENGLGIERARVFHSHFSKIEFTEKGGEKRHLTFKECGGYGPDFKPLIELIRERDWSPTFICESAGTQTEDARAMKEYYESR
ncbi:MAG: TIM barrel protein [Ruminococcus sp.]|nr:TIM barrel protein [Ruminococcus sp.]